MSKVNYTEGDWFVLPLVDDGFAVGRIARAGPSGVLFGYFFGSRFDAPPALEEVESLEPQDSILARQFSHLGLKQGYWSVLGSGDSWRRDSWPMPSLVRREELTNRLFLVKYDEDDPSIYMGETQISEDDVPKNACKDGLMGAGFVEEILTKQIE